MNFLILGSGPMAVEYAKVLQHMKYPFTVVGRGESSALNFYNETGVKAITGGHSDFLSNQDATAFTHCIVAVGEKHLGSVTRDLIGFGLKNILVEKPGGWSAEDIQSVANFAKQKGADVFVGYNRRFFASVLKAKEIIDEEQGVLAFNFEFTERSHIIETIEKEPGVKEEWFLANSTHVIDLAFYLGGKPQTLSAFTAKQLSWHPRAAVYSGAGVSDTGALFSYHANWLSPGGWGLELTTKNYRLVLRPMESLQIQKIGSAIEACPLDDALDKEFKPGLYRQVQAFVEKDAALPDIQEQCDVLAWYEKMNKQVATVDNVTAEQEAIL